MSKYFRRFILFFIFSFGSYMLAIYCTPYLILAGVKIKTGAVFNEPIYTDVISHKDRYVVMPNPDFLYVVCAYNTRKGPLKISGIMPDNSYCSLALYAANTKNFYIKNDKESVGKEFEFLISHEDCDGLKNTGSLDCISSPSAYGVMIIRILIDENTPLEQLKVIQKSFTLEEFAY